MTRLVSVIATAGVVTTFSVGALRAVSDPSSATLRGTTTLLLAAALLVPAVFLTVAVAAEQVDVPYCIYWAWSFVFLGMAPAFQVAHQSFPWAGHLSERTIDQALRLVLVGHLSMLCGYLWARRRRAAHSRSSLSTSTTATERLLVRMSVAYCAVAVVFIALMGTSLFNARSVFREQVLAISELPFGGTLYFLVTAGAVAVPSALIAAHRAGAHVSWVAVGAPVVCAAIVTNPLLGSRFLTGSFLVSVSIAALYGRSVLRLVPVASIVLLTVLFPTLDILRGDTSGSDGIRALDPATSVQTYDFDAFEMLGREVAVVETNRSELPSATHMALAPVLRWVPVAARPFIGDSGGAVVAGATGMRYTNVSMPLPAEGHLIAGPLGTVAVMGALGGWIGVSSARRRPTDTHGRRHGPAQPDFATRVCSPATAALLFIVLRGSLYEVLAYLLLVLAIYATLRRKGQVG